LLILLVWGALCSPLRAAGKEFQTLWCSLSPKELLCLTRLVEDYNQEQKNLVFNIRNFKSEEEMITALLNERQLPNLAVIPSYLQGDLISAGLLLPMEEVMEKISSTVRVMSKTDTFDSLVKGCTYQGVMWTFPFYARNYMALYDDDLLLESGSAKAPATWAELVSLGKKVNKETPAPLFYLPLDQPRVFIRTLRLFLRQAGVKIYDYDCAQTSFNTKEGEYTIKYLQNLVKTGVVKTDTPNYNAIVYFGTIGDLLDLERAGKHVKIARLPILKDKGASLVDCYTLAIFRNPNLRSVEKAFHLVYYLREFPQNLRWALETANLPAHKQVMRSPEYFQFMQLHPGLNNMIEVMNKGETDPIYLSYQSYLRILGEEIIKALKEGTDPKQALSAAEQRMKTFYLSPGK